MSYNHKVIIITPPTTVNAYKERDRVLAGIGYTSYKQYLRSDRWKEIRFAQLTMFPKCLRCYKPAEQVHHTLYTKENLLGRSFNGLSSVCAKCHTDIEFDGRKKNSLYRANDKLIGTVNWCHGCKNRSKTDCAFCRKCLRKKKRQFTAMIRSNAEKVHAGSTNPLQSQGKTMPV